MNRARKQVGPLYLPKRFHFAMSVTARLLTRAVHGCSFSAMKRYITRFCNKAVTGCGHNSFQHSAAVSRARQQVGPPQPSPIFYKPS